MNKSKLDLYIDKILEKMNITEKDMYRELIDFCTSINLRPKKVYKKNYLAIDFLNKNKNYSIMRFGINENHNIIFELRYYASRQYSQKFHEAIRKIIESYKGEYVGCYKCGNCHGNYTYTYPDGTTFIRCGFALIPVENITDNDIPEIKQLIDIQNQIYNNL
ncbi:MAG: hypothetical protein K0S41_2443 [Anaerocolumna sp.]|jgi:hypothetical protein|nr:hypothetical protein [Anaerocolumna sp.]